MSERYRMSFTRLLSLSILLHLNISVDSAFAPVDTLISTSSYRMPVQHEYRGTSSPTKLNGFFDDMGKMFEGFGGDDKGESDKNQNKNNEQRQSLNLSQGEQQIYPGCSIIFTIPAKSMKIGGLRLWLSLYLISQQNFPEKNTWRADQPTKTSIDLFYHDNSASLSLHFNDYDNTIRCLRMGSHPSVSYMMQESQVLHGVLNELEEVAFGNEEEVREENRLLNLDRSVLVDAKETLSFS